MRAILHRADGFVRSRKLRMAWWQSSGRHSGLEANFHHEIGLFSLAGPEVIVRMISNGAGSLCRSPKSRAAKRQWSGQRIGSEADIQQGIGLLSLIELMLSILRLPDLHEGNEAFCTV